MTEFADQGEETPRLRPPGLGLLLAEVRGIFEFNASLMLSPFLMSAPRGDGHPVLTLPGFLASDVSMAPMRRYLTELGYDPHAWRMGRNTGGLTRVRMALRNRLAEIHRSTGRKVSIIGWSLGGVYARDLALHAPEMVRYVVTLGSPFANDVRATNATRLYEALSGETVGSDPVLLQALAGDLPVPTTSIYSRADGIVKRPMPMISCRTRSYRHWPTRICGSRDRICAPGSTQSCATAFLRPRRNPVALSRQWSMSPRLTRDRWRIAVSCA